MFLCVCCHLELVCFPHGPMYAVLQSEFHLFLTDNIVHHDCNQTKKSTLIIIVKERPHSQSSPNTSQVEHDEIHLTIQKQLFPQRVPSKRTRKQHLARSSRPPISPNQETCPVGSNKWRSPRAPLHLEQVLVWLECCTSEVL